ncbi:MAG: hypothetical protein GAK28_02446 [Luteibacter sp.]|nr:MAG: hypothetical protein GAK28_02446 [Luteibacter sp.]
MLQVLPEFEQKAVSNERGTPFIIKAYKDSDGALVVRVHDVPTQAVRETYSATEDVVTEFEKSANGVSMYDHLCEQVLADMKQPGNKLYEA